MAASHQLFLCSLLRIRRHVRFGKAVNKGQNNDVWISGYLAAGKINLLLHPHSEILCGAALPGALFLFFKKNVPGVWQPKTVFLQFYLNNV